MVAGPAKFDLYGIWPDTQPATLPATQPATLPGWHIAAFNAKRNIDAPSTNACPPVLRAFCQSPERRERQVAVNFPLRLTLKFSVAFPDAFSVEFPLEFPVDLSTAVQTLMCKPSADVIETTPQNNPECQSDPMSTPAPMPTNATDLPDGADDFLAEHGLADTPLQGFDADASARRYFRVQGQDMLLMDDHQDPDGFAAFLKISAHLNALGLSAPRVLQARAERCLALLEDFGDTTYAHCLARGHDEADLYHLALETLLHLHHDAAGGQISCPVYDMSVHLDEVSIFSHWFAPAIVPDLDVASFDRQFRALWRSALPPVATRHETLVLRDFHVDNLMLLDKRQGVARCGLLDFQDAILGPCEYDLVSLLQDARRDLADGLEETLLSYYCKKAPQSLGGSKAIRQRYHILAAQRHARILGVFARLHLRDRKSRYLAFVPRVLRQFQTAARDAGLSEITGFLDATLPDWAAKAAEFQTTLRPLDAGPAGAPHP